MRTLLTGLLLPLILVSAVSVASAQPATFGPTLPPRRVLNRHQLHRAWWAQAVLNPSRDTVQYLTIDEEILYVQATSGVVTAFDNESGERLWARLLGSADQQSYPAVSNDTLVLIVSGMKLYTMDKFNGEVLWELELPRFPSTRPTIDRQAVYIGTLDGSMFAFDLRTIRELYEENLLPQWSGEALMWRYKTAERVTTPAVSTGRLVHFASSDGLLYAVTAETAQQVFQFETDAPVSAPIVQSEGLLYLPSEDFKLYCLDAENGLVQWAFPSGLPIRTEPVVIGEDIFIAPDRGGLFRLSKRAGKEQWWKPDGRRFLAATPDKVFLADRRNNVVIVDRQDGTTLGALPLQRSYRLHLTNDRTDRLYVATSSGLVVCIREQGRQFPLYHKYPERRPILPQFADESETPASQNTPQPAAP